MKVPFELEWMGGPAEHHFRKARPGVDELPWGTVIASDYAPAAIEFARTAWTEVAINEYRAIASFSEVLRALVDVKAPLDVIGMTSDFLADECSHVELASRMAMELGGAAPRAVDLDHFATRPLGRTSWQRANELVLRVSCIAEAFSGGTAAVSYETTTCPLPRAVYATILRDEAHHRRLGGIYFEWALPRIDEPELQRLGAILLDSLRTLAPSGRLDLPQSPRKPTFPITTCSRSGGFPERGSRLSRARSSCAIFSIRSSRLGSQSLPKSGRRFWRNAQSEIRATTRYRVDDAQGRGISRTSSRRAALSKILTRNASSPSAVRGTP